MTNWIKQNGHEYYLKTPFFKAYRKSSIVIYLPCMTLMQTCLMCWSVGALPWGRKKEAVIPGTVDRALLRGKWTDGAGDRRLDLQQDNRPHCPGAGVWAGRAALTPCAGGRSLHRGTAGLPATHRRALDARQAGGALFALHASGSRRSLRSLHSGKPPAAFRPPQARLPGVTHLEQSGTVWNQD